MEFLSIILKLLEIFWLGKSVISWDILVDEGDPKIVTLGEPKTVNKYGIIRPQMTILESPEVTTLDPQKWSLNMTQMSQQITNSQSN